MSIEEQIRAIVREELARLAERPQAPDLVTLRAYAAARGISVSTVRAAIREGRLEAYQIGRAVRVRPGDEIARPVRAREKVDRTRAAAGKLGLQVVR